MATHEVNSGAMLVLIGIGVAITLCYIFSPVLKNFGKILKDIEKGIREALAPWT